MSLKESEYVYNIFPKWFDNILTKPLIFTFIVLSQGSFGSMGIIQIPERLKKILDYPIARFIFVLAIAYSAYGDIESTLVSTLVFFLFLHLIRTDEERVKVPYLI